MGVGGRLGCMSVMINHECERCGFPMKSIGAENVRPLCCFCEVASGKAIGSSMAVEPEALREPRP